MSYNQHGVFFDPGLQGNSYTGEIKEQIWKLNVSCGARDNQQEDGNQSEHLNNFKLQSIMNWKILSSEYLFSDLWFKVRKDICETPGGKIVNPYYVYEFPTWVTALAMTEEGKVILERQYRHALGEVCIEIPGGCVDDTDGNLEEAIKRELLEETGYSFSSFEYLGRVSANPSTNNNLMHMFLAKGGKKTALQQLDHNEEIEIELVSLTELKQMIRENKIVQAMHLTCMLYALERMGELRY